MRRRLNLVEMQITCGIMVVVALIAVPTLMQVQKSSQDALCITNQLAATEGSLEAGTTCLASGLEYAAGGDEVKCPSAEPHLPAQTRFVKTGERWAEQNAIEATTLGEAEVSNAWTRSVKLSADPPRLTSEASAVGAYLVAPLLGLICVACVIGLIALIVWFAREMEFPPHASDLGEGLFLLAFPIGFGLLTGYGAAEVLRSETIDLRPGEVVIETKHPGRDATTTTLPIRACAPLRMGSGYSVVVFAKDERVELFTTPSERLDAVAVVCSAVRVP